MSGAAGGVAGERQRPLAGLAWAALSAALFACMNVSARLASAEVDWTLVAASRCLVGAAVVVSVALASGARLAVQNQKRAWARSLAGTGALLCTFYALGAPAMALGDVVTLASTSPIFVALLAPVVLKEPSGRGVWAPTLLAFGGAALVALPRFDAAGHLAAVATLGALCSAVAMMMLRLLGPKESPEAVVVHFSLVSGAALTLLALPALRAPGPSGLLWLLATGLSGGLAQLAMTRAYALERAARVSAAGYLGVALTHLLGALVLGEGASANQTLGAGLVVGAGLLLTAGALRSPAPGAPPPDAPLEVREGRSS